MKKHRKYMALSNIFLKYTIALHEQTKFKTINLLISTTDIINLVTFLFLFYFWS
jgi:hypothetical protein